MIPITDTISLSEHEIEEQFIRAPGPGGQNVNKVASAVQLRFDAANSPALTWAVFRRLKTLAGSRMTRDGVIVLTANQFRSQIRNREDALERLKTLIRTAATPPTRRRPSRPSLSSKRRMSEGKRRQGALKKHRRKSNPTDD
ncbi:MAG: aminoacyl-tRNA hydrolase [Rhodospirillaceae bacterium]|nr:aminoacyl-tRNA hydrolase [Rhodospirillaceae bacterium]